MHFLENTIPIVKPATLKEFKPVKLDTKLLEAAVGKYRHESSGSVYTFSLDGERMFVTAQSGRKDEFFAESDTSFFRADEAGWLTATRDQTGRVTRVVWNTENAPSLVSAPEFVRVD